MRDFFIGAFEKLIAVIIILLAVGVVIGTISFAMMPAAQGGGLLPAIGVLIGGSLYTIIMGGGLYLAFGIYHNTKRTAEAVEQLAQR